MVGWFVYVTRRSIGKIVGVGEERETEPGAKAFLAWKGVNMTVGGNRDSDGWGLYSYIETHLQGAGSVARQKRGAKS